ncbi:hypothetical protein ACFP3Q_08425 [Nocardioides sp. GCM10027113]|uniref:hypothetical protein n=1 Tax=unclassified Nocardioides TaxID=2615069 RepID=UPI003607C00C
MPHRPAAVRPAALRAAAVGAIATAVVATALQLPASGDRTGSARGSFEASRDLGAVPGGDLAPDGPDGHDHDGHGHDHGDPATKNALSRSGEDSPAAQDPTTPEERAASTAAVAAGRATPDPELTTTSAGYRAPARPGNRYAMANGCYAVAVDGAWVARGDDGLRSTARQSAAEPFFLKPTTLGTYLLHGTATDLLAGSDSSVSLAAEPGGSTEWTVRRLRGGFALRVDDGFLARAADGGLRVGPRPDPVRFVGTDGCTDYPESQVDITGAPFAGVSPTQEVRGFVDAHTHGMAFEFLGGEVHCGRPWHEYGAPYALVDCDDHTLTDGKGAALEAVLSGEPTHDPVGWPTFKDWPAPNSLTHEGTYYRWMERSWRGGQRLFVNLLVENNKLCELYPLKRNSCDDMDSIRLQAQRMYELQDYIDAQWGGPGRGWYRIVRNPWEARRVINAGKMAIVMGIETSVPFGCTFKNLPGGDVPACTTEDIDRQLDEVHDLGVRQMELVNKFDNALSGVAGDTGETGVAVNSANFLETGSYWDMEHCEPEHPDAHDRNQHAAPEISADQQDALFGAIAQLFAAGNLPDVPVYGRPDHCNQRGLTTLGQHVIDGLAQRHMLFDPDHMSVKARDAALDQLEAMGYSGVLSSHSWATEDAYPRIYELGGYVAPYAGDSAGFVEKWRKHLGWADDRFYFGFGYGADMNGLGAQGDPRGADVPNPVNYPFEGLGGVTVHRQRAGERVYDINVDGVAQYGLYPDWIEDLRILADSTADGDPAVAGDAIVEDMARGAEAYLQTWERAHGIAPDPCRNPDLRLDAAELRDRVRTGMTTRQLLTAIGQPFTRLGGTYTYCATSGGAETTVEVAIDRRGRVTGVRTV